MDLYKKIERAIRLHEETLTVNDIIQEIDVRHTIRLVMRDNPDIFWFVHQYHFDNERKIITFRYQFSKKRTELIQKSIEDVIENDFQIEHVRTLAIYEQIMYVYKWLLTYCNYNINSAYNQNIDSVFVRRNSVCTGYAKAAQYLFALLGIRSQLVFGRLNNDREDGRHCWNMVYIEGTFYHMDVCFGDLALESSLIKVGASRAFRHGNYNYNCFCVSTEEISKTRSIEDIESLPICNKILNKKSIERLAGITVNQRNNKIGCLLSHNGSTADIYLCSKNKNIVLKKFRGDDNSKCAEEYRYMDSLRGCEHLIQLKDSLSDWEHNVIAVEQSTPIVDLLCSHYYHSTLNGVLKMIKDITLGWLECQHQGIMYRDIHVCNIYKANNGLYKLGDFGSCTYDLSGLRERVGNPWFMAPETYIGGQFDERSAVYSITTVIYFVLNGLRPPFVDGDNEGEALQRKMNGEDLPEPALLSSLPKEMAEKIMTELITRGCAFYPTKRIQTCKELLSIIEEFALHSNLKNQKIELRFAPKDPETVLGNTTVPDVYITRDIHHKFAYGEEGERIACSLSCELNNDEVERTATTAGSSFFDIDNNGCIVEEEDSPDETRDSVADDIDVDSIPMSDDVENCCKTMYNVEPNFKCLKKDLSSELRRMSDVITQLTKTMNDSVINIPQGKSAVFPNCNKNTFEPNVHRSKIKCKTAFSILERLFKRRESSCDVFGSIFAPAEVKRKFHMLVQIYLHLYEETVKVKNLALESDKNAERRDYIPLQCKLKKGDNVDILLNIYGESLLKSEHKCVVWQGSFTKCSFDYFVPKDIDVDELSCVAMLTVNSIPVGEMRFITRIVEEPRQLNPEIIAHKYSKVFISYSHQDESKVKFLHEGLELGLVPHFFDRKCLKTGDVFPQVIKDYINSADLFILCWSENASKSEYVQKERLQALERAFPQVKPEQEAKLRIYPMSIEPHAELPNDMKDNYHFGEI